MSRRVDRLGPKSQLEPSARSRGLLYAATAIYVAAAHNVHTVEIPENGQVALNPPLTASRPGGCSTRSVHPRTVHLINQIIEDLQGEVKVRNPFINYTKGEVCRLVHETRLLPSVLELTVSCSHPPMRRQGGQDYHCGYCYPCLVRRAGLLVALGKDCTSYKVDPWLISPNDNRMGPRTKTSDIQALHQWLTSPFKIANLIADTPLPPEVSPGEMMPVILRGREELLEMLDRLLPQDSLYRISSS